MNPAPQLARLWRNLLRLLLIVALVWGTWRLVGWAHGLLPAVDAGGAGISPWLIAGLVGAYVLMLALPFVPGVEVGIALLMLGGAWVAPMVWGATVAGLLLSFWVGRCVPDASLERLCRDLGLARVAGAIARIAPLDQAARLAHLQQALPPRVARLALPGRYLVLAVLVNMPGNIALGGGGGLLLYAGLSRLFAPVPLTLTVMLATAPVPFAVWLLGYHGMA